MLSSKPKKVLIISYYFPPSGGAGVQRILKFVKYLPEFGWEPIVLAPRNADYPAYDEKLMQEIPASVKVYHSKIIEPYKLYRKFTGKKSGEATDIATLSRDSKQQQNARERISEYIRSYFFIPDARVGWRPFAVREGLKVIQKEEISVLLSSAPPYTCHLIAKTLKNKTGLAWICDFRDSWVGWLSAARRRGLPRKIECNMEHDVLKQADRILTVSAGVQEDLQNRNPDLIDSRWVLLPNGYDSADFEGLSPTPREESDKLVLTYTGSLYGNRNPTFLLKALEELIAEDPTWKNDVRLVFIGRVGEPIQDQLSQEKFKDIIKIIPYVTHHESIRYLLASDVLLLIIDDAPANKGILTGKLYEYLGARKPILALAPQGDAANLIRELKAGFIVPPKNVAQIKQILIEIRNKWKNNQLETNLFDEEKLKVLDRRELTRRLANILNEVLIK